MTHHRMLGSVSDLMAGLMMVFLFIAIAYMVEVRSNEEKLEEQNIELEDEVATAKQMTAEAETQKLIAEEQKQRAEKQETKLAALATSLREQGETIREIAATYTELQDALYLALRDEFHEDLEKWNASLEPDNTIRFNEPEVLFASGESEIRDLFREILSDFFPRYVEVLRRPEYRNEIDEVRIEGHTSTDWAGATTLEDRYLRNAELSQARAFSVLDYCFRQFDDGTDRLWLIDHLRANGVSFARPVTLDDGGGMEDKDRSRRVEFRAISKSRERILKILETTRNNQATVEEESP